MTNFFSAESLSPSSGVGFGSGFGFGSGGVYQLDIYIGGVRIHCVDVVTDMVRRHDVVELVVRVRIWFYQFLLLFRL